MINKNIGSDFEEFLAEDGILEECSAVAVKRVLSMELQDLMHEKHVNRTELAKRMNSSRSQIARLLNPEETGTSIDSLTRAAAAMGKHLEIRLS